MHNPIICERACNEQHLAYLNTITAMNNLIKVFNCSPAYTDYLSMLAELMAHYDPDMTCEEQLSNIQIIVKKWTEGGIQ